MSSGVSLLSRKARAMRPARPTRMVSAPVTGAPSLNPEGSRATRSPASRPARTSVCPPETAPAAIQRRRALPSATTNTPESPPRSKTASRGRADARLGGGRRAARAARRGRSAAPRPRAGRPAPRTDGSWDRPPGRSTAPRPDTGAACPSTATLRLEARAQGWRRARRRGSPELEAAVPFDLDQGGSGRDDVAHVDGQGRDAAGEGRPQDRVGQAVLGALPRRLGRGRARRRVLLLAGCRRSLLAAATRRVAVRPPPPSARPRLAATADRSAVASRRTTTAPAATRSPSRWGTSTTEAETRAARAARCRARTTPGTASLRPRLVRRPRSRPRGAAPSRLQRPLPGVFGFSA